MKFYLMISLMIIFSSCHKNDPWPGEPYEITGHLYRYGCPKRGYPNVKLELGWSSPNELYATSNGGGLVASAITDSNGYFKLSGNDHHQCLDLILNTYDDIHNCIRPENLHDLEIYMHPSTTLNITLNVTNPYSSNDTLFVQASDSLGKQLKVAGPFHSGFLYSVKNYTFNEVIFQNNPKYNTQTSILYFINRNSVGTHNNINLNLCDTSTVVFNIK